MDKRVRSRPGFTLIELLVVVAIIAVLIAILLPSLGKAREQSKRTACLANLRSLAMANQNYSMDFNDRLPNLNPPNTAVDSQGATLALVTLYSNYAHAAKAFHCPSDREPVPSDITTAEFLMANSVRTSYDFYSVYWLPEHGPRWSPLNRAPLVWDQDGGSTSPDELQNHGTKGGNVAFGDAHADWQPAKEWDKTDWPHPASQFYQ